MCFITAAMLGATVATSTATTAALTTAGIMASIGITSSVLGTGVSVYQQRQNAEAQAKWQKQKYAANKLIAERAAFTGYAQADKRLIQESAAASQRMEEAYRRQMKASGRAIVAAGEGGAMGQSFEVQVLGDYERQKGAFNAATLTNLGYVGDQTTLSKEQQRMGLAGRTLGALPKPVQMPSYLNAALAIGGQLGMSTSQLFASRIA
jgi:hypothetical protein